MTFRILVVDDEPVMTESIEHIIKTDIELSTLVERARNGREAIEKAWKFRPDLIITDIKMPGINGLGVIREIKTQYQNVRFIILSAYEQFTFAKEAVALGVDEYLLKPVNRVRMVETIRSCLKRIEEDSKKREEDLALKEKIEKMIPTLESGFLLSLLFYDDFNMSDCCELLEFQTHSGFMLVAQMRQQGDKTLEAAQLLSFGENCSQILKQYRDCLTCRIGRGRVVAFIPVSCEKDNQEYMEAVAKNLIAKTRVANAFIAVGIGSVRANLDELRESYGESIVALNSIATDQSFGAFMLIDEFKRGMSGSEEYPAELKKDVLARLFVGDAAGALHIFKTLFDWCAQKYQNDLGRLKSKMVEVMAMLAARASDGEISGRTETVVAMLAAKNEGELFELCKAQISELLMVIADAQKGRISEIVNRANQIIERNYGNELTLEGISKELGVSSSYFSRLYKEQTGANFIDYLTKVRIDTAKKLFLNTDMSVKEVSYKTGYFDPNYFSRLFKKTTGVTPTDFKGRAAAKGASSKEEIS